MFAWLLWRLDRLERLHAVARAIISEFGPGPTPKCIGGSARRRATQERGIGGASPPSSPAGCRGPPASTPQPSFLF